MTKYRIKTKQEFIEEFGEDWRDVGWNDEGRMDYLLGVEIDQRTTMRILEDQIKLDLTNKNEYFDYDHWSISYEMLKEIKSLPNYNEKKTLVYD